MPEEIERSALTEVVYYILLSLYAPLHGYAMMQNISRLTGGRVNLGAGTLYGAIKILVERQWIERLSSSVLGTRKKEYIITELGKKAVSNEMIRLEELMQNGRKITGGQSK